MKQVPELIINRYLGYWASTDPYFSGQPEEAPEVPSTSANPFSVLPIEPTEEQSPINIEPTEEVADVDSDHSSTPTSRHQSLEPSRAPSPVAHYDIESQAATPATPVSPVSPAAPVACAPTPVYHIPIVAQLQPPANMSAQASTTITSTQGAVPAAQPTTGANGSLKGNAPKPFTGECSESAKFLLAFKIFWASNYNHPQMDIPLNQCYTFLMYLE